MLIRSYHIALLLSLLLFSCKKESALIASYQVEMVTARAFGDEINFVQDDTGILLKTDVFSSNDVKDSSRVLLTFAPKNGKVVAPVTEIEVFGASRVLTKNFEITTTAQLDTIVDDPLKIESVWMSGGYINIRSILSYHSKPHTLRLIMNSDLSDSFHFLFELRHSTEGDQQGTDARSYSSFPVHSLLDRYPKAKISVLVNSSNYGQKAYHF